MELNYEKTKRFLKMFYVVGILGMSISFTHEYFVKLTPFTQLMILSILLIFHNKINPKFILFAFFIALAGYFVEVAGVKTGIIFGDYHYGRTLGVKIMGTPLLIGINWFILTYCTYNMAGKLRIHPLLQIVLASLFMVLYDVVLEPAAMRTDMWTWQNNVVPFKNYLAWFIVSFILIAMYHLFNIRKDNKIAGYIYLIQILFFFVLNIVDFTYNRIGL